MATRYFSYSMKDGSTRLGADYFNPIWKDIDTRLDKLENLRISWEQATQDLNEFGLERIDSTISPVLAAAQAELAEAVEANETLQGLIEDADIQGQIDTALAAQDTAVTDQINAAIAGIQAQIDALKPIIYAGL